MSKYKPTLSETICGEYLPFVIMGFGAFVVKWMVFGDYVKDIV